MSFVRHYIGHFLRVKDNVVFYLRKRKFVLDFFKECGYTRIKPFNFFKWHHNLFLFTAMNGYGDSVFVKLSKIKRVIKNENKAYKKLRKNAFLENHIIEHKEYIKKNGYKALVLKQANGTVLNEDWMVDNIEQAGTLIKIVDQFSAMSLVHRDVKLDNFIYDEGRIKIFDFSFMIDKSEKGKLKEIDLSSRRNMLKLMDLGNNYKPEPLKWDDYYSLYIIFVRFFKKNKNKLADEQIVMVENYIKECSKKVGSNNYTILKDL